jgi:hypothetical protein
MGKMTDNAYKRAMERLEFDKGFEERTLALLEEESRKRRRNRRTAAYACCCAVAACAVLAIILWGAPDNKARLAQVTQPSAALTAENVAESAVIASRRVVVSSQYGAGESSYTAPKAGEVLITEGVRRAIEDEKNEDAYFFVQIYVIVPEQYANSFSEYVYNGRTIAEWSELASLGKGEYPYPEYNMDHGGNITEEQFKELERQAKTLDAGKNLASARKAYDTAITPMLNEVRQEREAAESVRLKNLGYDVFLADTWTYKGEGEKQPYKILAGVLSKAQITGFIADDTCGYMIEWVHNGDGVFEWDEYRTEARK